jgi:hypothetical protein
MLQGLSHGVLPPVKEDVQRLTTPCIKGNALCCARSAARAYDHLKAGWLGCVGSLDTLLPPANADMALCRARVLASAENTVIHLLYQEWHIAFAYASHYCE